jgi:F0F1-type ATP synthase delta subunit
MALAISRRKLAAHTAKRIAGGDKIEDALTELAAYLVDNRRAKEADLIVRDVEAALLAHGIVVASATSARPLSMEAKNALETFVKNAYTGTTKVVLREAIDPSVIAGVRLELPDKQLDATVASKLEKLKI